MKPRLLSLLIAALSAAAQTPPATLLVLNKGEAMLAIMDPASGKTLGRVPTGEGPHELVVSTDGKLAFAANYGASQPGSTISVIDIAARKELRRVDLGPLRRPHGLAFAGGKLYFTAEVNKLIGRYDPASNQIDWLMGTGQNSTHMVYVAGDLNHIFTANIGSDSISILEQGAGANWTQTVVPVGKGPEGFDVTPGGRELWAANSRDGSVSIIDLPSKKMTQTLDVKTKRSNRLKFTPDGKLALITDLEGGELVVVDTASHKEVKRIALGKAPEGILIPPGGTRAYVAVSGENRLAVIDLKLLAVESSVSTGSGPDGMAWVGPGR